MQPRSGTGMIVAALTDKCAGDLGHGADRGGGLGPGQRQRPGPRNWRQRNDSECIQTTRRTAEEMAELYLLSLRSSTIPCSAASFAAAMCWSKHMRPIVQSRLATKFATIRLILSQNLPTSADPTTSFGTCQYGWSSIGSCNTQEHKPSLRFHGGTSPAQLSDGSRCGGLGLQTDCAAQHTRGSASRQSTRQRLTKRPRRKRRPTVWRSARSSTLSFMLPSRTFPGR